MGTKAVSSLQYNVEGMQANIKVETTVTEEESGNPKIVFQAVDVVSILSLNFMCDTNSFDNQYFLV